MIDGTFWISFTTIVAGVVSGVIVILHKSKCKETSCCWGCFECTRDVGVEERIEEHEHPTNQTVL